MPGMAMKRKAWIYWINPRRGKARQRNALLGLAQAWQCMDFLFQTTSSLERRCQAMLGMATPGVAGRGKDFHMPRTVSVSELVFDRAIYPRKEVCKKHVNEIIDAIESGVVMPPIVVQKKTMRIVDGVHRWTAYKIADIGDAEVVEKHYASEKEVFLDCVRLNSGHGKRLTEADRLHIAEKAVELSITSDSLCSTLHVVVAPSAALVVDRPAPRASQLPFVRTGEDRRRDVADDRYVKAPECGHKSLESTLHDGWCMACWTKRGGRIRSSFERADTAVARAGERAGIASDLAFIRRRNILYANELREFIDEADVLDEEFSEALASLDKSIRRKLKVPA